MILRYVWYLSNDLSLFREALLYKNLHKIVLMFSRTMLLESPDLKLKDTALERKEQSGVDIQQHN